MRELPLYLPGKSLAEGGLGIAIEREPPRDLDHGCRRCGLWERARSVCIPADGDPDGILFVGEKPGREEDVLNRPNVGLTGSYLREQVARWAGATPIAYTNAVLCAPGIKEVTPGMVAACRGYLAGVLRDARPKRIVCLGSVAAQAVLGRGVSPMSVRRGHAWAGGGVPVFLVMHNANALRNRLLRLAFEADLEWAMTVPVPPFPSPKDATCSMVETPADAQVAAGILQAAGKFAYDCEWVGRPYGRLGFILTGLAASVVLRGDAALNEHVFVWDAWALQDPARCAPLRALMSNPAVAKVGSNLAVDVHAVECERGLGAPVCGDLSDVRLKRKLIEADADGELAVMAELVGMGGHKLEADAHVEAVVHTVRAELRARAKEAASGQRRLVPADRIFQHVPANVEELAFRLAATDPDAVRSFATCLLPLAVGARYNARDALATARLERWCDDRLASDQPVRQVWKGIVQGAMTAVQRVERWGIAVDVTAINVTKAHLQSMQDAIDARLQTYVPPGFSWDSPKQVADLFYQQLKIGVPKLTEHNNPSVSEEALEELRGRHPAIDDLLEHRRLVKLRTTYVEGLLKAVGVDGRVHGYILLDGAGTGRSSMQDPNLQNIPRGGAPPGGTPEGTLIRQCFVAPEGKVLVEFDYATLEPRVAAILSGDPALRQLFIDGRDFHGETAALVKPHLWPSAPAITKGMRQDAKPIGLGIMYGKAAPALAETLGCTRRTAQTVIDAVLGKYRALASWIRDSISHALTNGHMQTWWAGQPARRRPLWHIASHDKSQQGNAERASYNGRIQGTASDFLIRSLTEVVRLIEEEFLPAIVLLPVHDSLLLEVAEPHVPEVVDEVRRAMLGWDSAGVPLEVEVKVGPNWGAMQPYEAWAKARNPPTAAQSGS